MSNPRIEEVSDDEDDDQDFADDPEEMDLDAFDFARPQKVSLQSSSISAAVAAEESQMTPEAIQSMLQPRSTPNVPSSSSLPPPPDTRAAQQQQLEQSKIHQCIYPVYFDASRSRAQGRRVSAQDAVANPLARDLVDALTAIEREFNIPLQILLEPGRTHPKDWANPGRVRVLVKKDGKPVCKGIDNKHSLYKLISEYLKGHPTTEESPMRLQIRGLPMPKDNKILPPAVPRGFKINKILPLHSPALSGGGVSDNLFKDMMAEMGGGAAGPGGAMGEIAQGQGQQKKVKEKKKK